MSKLHVDSKIVELKNNKASSSAITYGSGKPFLGGIGNDEERRKTWDRIFGPKPISKEITPEHWPWKVVEQAVNDESVGD